MSWEKSDVMKEFGKIMHETELTKTAARDDKKVIEEKRLKPAEKNIIEIAHPSPVFVAESQCEGGLVENLNEQHKKMMAVIDRVPTGSIMHRYTAAINALVKMANACDEEEESELADTLTVTAAKLVEMVDALPFDKALDK